MFSPTQDLSFRDKLLKLLPAGGVVLWKLYEELNILIFGHCNWLMALVGIVLLSLYSFLVPWLHHSHQDYRGHLFHACVSLLAFLATTLPNQTLSQCLFHWSNPHLSLLVNAHTHPRATRFQTCNTHKYTHAHTAHAHNTGHTHMRTNLLQHCNTSA